MGGLQGLPFPQQPQQPDQQASSPTPQPDPSQYAETAPTPQPFAKQQQFYQNQIDQNTPVDKQGVKGLLSNFFQGMGSSMMRQAGLPTPYDKVQQAQQGLDRIQQMQSTMDMHRSALAMQAQQMQQMQRSPAPPGFEQQGIMPGSMLTPKEFSDQLLKSANMRQQAANATQLQGMKGDTAETVQGMKGDVAANKLKSTLDMFHQGQQFKVWKTNQDNQTKRDVANLTQNKAPAAIMQTAAFAQGGLSMLQDAKDAMQRLESRGVLGNVASNKIEDWIFGKGLVDPSLPPQDKEDIGKLRAAATYTSSAAMRAHTGRSSREIYDDFKNTMGINQGPDAWKGAMQETENMLGQYSQGATNAAIAKLRGVAPPAQPNSPSGQGNAGKALSLDEARGYLTKAGGDKDRARALAKADGRSF